MCETYCYDPMNCLNTTKLKFISNKKYIDHLLFFVRTKIVKNFFLNFGAKNIYFAPYFIW